MGTQFRIRTPSTLAIVLLTGMFYGTQLARPTAQAVTEGRFTASVSNWPKEGSQVKLSGRAYVVLKDRQNYNHVVLCHDDQASRWTVVFTGGLAAQPSQGVEFPLGNNTYANVYHTPDEGPKRAHRYVSRTLQQGVLRIEEATGDAWVGSASASRGDVQLQVEFHAIPVAPAVIGATRASGPMMANGVHRGRCGVQ